MRTRRCGPAWGMPSSWSDFHGSSGYGEAFAKSHRRTLGRSAARRFAKRLVLRAGAVRIPGWRLRPARWAESYGGFMVAWICRELVQTVESAWSTMTECSTFD